MLFLLLMALVFFLPAIPIVHSQSSNQVSIVSDASTLGNKAYAPNPIMIKKGDTVLWTNKDFGIHTVTDNQEKFSSKDLRPNQSFEHTFDATGIFEYHCNIHPTMIGKVVVT